jgi:hypothetical protein
LKSAGEVAEIVKSEGENVNTAVVE